MSALQKYMPFFSSAVLMCVVLLLIYPHYQYYIDPDGTAYLTIAQRYASGDYATAINGYWSPWACWLTAALIKGGISAIPASVVINAVGATGFLYITQSFLLRFAIARQLQWLLCSTVASFLCYAIFWQSFDDLWECFFLLSALRLMLADNFKSKPALWLLCGVVGALAYFAKAYSFPFFILNTLCCTYFLCKSDKAQWLKILLTAIVVMIACSLPWIIALHNKYGIWITSTSGSLNMSWYLVGHPEWKQGIELLLPPAYHNSPYYWEDPYMVNGATPHFWSSWHLFGLQLLRVGLNLWKLLVSMVQLSIFFPLLAVVLARVALGRKDAPTPSFTIALSFLLFPLGYVLINFEARYLWYMLPLAMAGGSLFLQHHFAGKSYAKLLPWLLAVSFLVYPAWCMSKMYDEGAQEYKIAQQLKQLNIHGSFTCITPPGAATQRMERIAYFSGNQLYSIPSQDADPQEVLQEMRRYGVKYFCSFGSAITDGSGKPFLEVSSGDMGGLHVFLVNP